MNAIVAWIKCLEIFDLCSWQSWVVCASCLTISKAKSLLLLEPTIFLKDLRCRASTFHLSLGTKYCLNWKNVLKAFKPVSPFLVNFSWFLDFSNNKAQCCIPYQRSISFSPFIKAHYTSLDFEVIMFCRWGCLLDFPFK